MRFWLVPVSTTTGVYVPVTEPEALAPWQLGLATLGFVVGFIALVYATRRRPGTGGRGQHRNPPHPRDSSWWNP